MTDFAIGAAQNVGNRWGLLSLRVHTGHSADPPWTRSISRGASRQQTLLTFLLVRPRLAPTHCA